MRDAVREQWLDDNGVRWEYVRSVELAKLDSTHETETQTRVTGADPETVERYATKAANGGSVVFPALVVDGGFSIIDGHQRKTAFVRAGVAAHDVYRVLTTDPVVIRRLRRTANTLNGLPPGTEELLMQARQMVKEGATRSHAAEVLGLREHKVTAYIRAEDLRDELVQDGADPAAVGGLPETRLLRLNTVPMPDVRSALVPVASKLRSATELESIVEETRAARSHADAMAVVERWSQRVSARNGAKNGNGARPAKMPLATLDTLLRKVEREVGRSDPSLVPSDRAEQVAGRCRSVAASLLDLSENLKGVTP